MVESDEHFYFTNILMRDTMDSTEPSIYRIKRKGDCGPCLNCTVWERFTSYEDFQNNRPFDNDIINPNIACYPSTIRIYGGFVYCHTSSFKDSIQYSHMVKINATDGSVVAKEHVQINDELTMVKGECIQNLYNRGFTTIEYLVDRTGFWVLYRPYFNYKSYILQQIDPEDLSTIRRIPIGIHSDRLSLMSPLVMMCGKLYLFHFDSNMVKVSKVFDISNPSVSFNAMTTLTKNPLYPYTKNSLPLVHFNPLSNELFLYKTKLVDNAPGHSMNYRIQTTSCTSKFHVDFIFNIHSTILWSLHQTGEEQMYQQVDILSRVVNIADLNELSKVADMLTTCHNPICSGAKHSSSNPCAIQQIKEQIKIYADKVKPQKDGSAVVLQTSQNQKELLQQETLRSISQKLEEQLRALQEQTITNLITSLDTMKEALPDYFSSLATFDQGKADADVGFLYMRLEDYKKSITRDSTKVGTTIGKYAEAAILSTSLELGDKIAFLGLQIAGMFNPGKLIAGDSFTDVLDAAAQVAEATTQLIRAKQFLQKINTIGAKFQILKMVMDKNLQKQTNIKNMFISAWDKQLKHSSTEQYMVGFLKEYSDYDPVFTKGMFGEIGGLLTETIDELCELIFSGETSTSNIFQSIFAAGPENCVNAKTDIERLLATYDEMYDFQYDLMEAMAEFVRATISRKSAQQISTSISQKITAAKEAQNERTKGFAARLSALQLIAANKNHIGTLVRDACNLIEYKNAGKSVEFCKDLRLTIDPTSRNYDSLVAYDYTQDMCSDDFSVKILNIPAAVRRNGTGITFPFTIDLERLYNGEEVYFQVPDSSWLATNRWMNAEDASKANFIRQFELFLPPMFKQQSQEESEVHVRVEMVGDNRIFPHSDKRKYSFSSSTVYNLRYTDSRRCYNPVRPISNPYDTRDCPPLQQPCIVSPGTMVETVYHPSIYSRWKIRLVTSGGRLRPTPSGEFFLKAGVKICHKDPSTLASLSETRPATTVRAQCCADANKFYDKSGVCQPCPSGSCVHLSGYYCDRNCP